MCSLDFCRAAAARTFMVTSLLALCGASYAANVVLRDGTVIHGEVKALQDGVYTVETASVGMIHVRKEEVRSIDESGKSASASGVQSSASAASLDADELDATKSRITRDPGLLAAVLALENDPDVLAILRDPDIMNAIAAGDYQALMNNPKIVALMNNEKVRDIIDGVR